jgi:hypothetical protein
MAMAIVAMRRRSAIGDRRSGIPGTMVSPYRAVGFNYS